MNAKTDTSSEPPRCPLAQLDPYLRLLDELLNSTRRSLTSGCQDVTVIGSR
ncbi:hypothetical protein [Saccharopolyspora phatthalungensis]|uniref:Uncharacterized protein n=1 Tax=Saccharopolyspora phatthalungensis TaxID=664693 RepID=A0A840QJK8_9PSEU|nr:hypothetical protein [Saccharopolyspora phatthalungensis]MBB5159259.1 hypothetical protein [Saccharopolyspora phatthalungensis]